MTTTAAAASTTAVTTPAPVDAAAIRAEERKRCQDLRALAVKAKVDSAHADAWIEQGLSLDDARTLAIDLWAAQDSPAETRPGVRVTSVVDEREKFRAGAGAWLAHKAGVSGILASAAKARGETVDLSPGEFRGLSLVDLARASLDRSGIKTSGLGKMDLVATALTNTTSDFPVLLESTMNKILLAAYATTPDTWSRFCAIGSVSDFRAHNRYRTGSFAALDTVPESAEYKNRSIPDGEKASITAKTKGNIIVLTRQAIINDDMDAFSRLVTMLGRAARMSIEVDVYAMFALNSGFGPTMPDGNALFHASHSNIVATTGAPSVATFDAGRTTLASQRDPSGNEYLDLRPAVWVGPIGLGGTARVVNDAQYDPDTANKLQMPNRVRGLVADVVDTPRLTSTPWYLFASPDVAPVYEVAFLDGEQDPYLDNQDGWRADGVEWKVRLDYGTAAIDWRGAARNAG